jgi:uncharacterized membrane protein YjjP (DUF1212 family)
MKNAGIEEGRDSVGSSGPLDPATFDLITSGAALLFANGQTTEGMVSAVIRTARTRGLKANVFPRWGELTVRIEGNASSQDSRIAVDPSGVDMNKVAAAMAVFDQVQDGRMDTAEAKSAFAGINRLPPVSLLRFAVMAAAGAAALSEIFGVTHFLSLVLIALSAGAGAVLRRWLAGISRNPFVQPFCAALLAGIIGAIAVRLQLSSVLRLVAVCPCMVLVPGPHILNGMLDLARSRIPLGGARLAFAGLITLMISAGLVLGLTLGGANLPASALARPVPLGYDVIAAGVAVAAYCTFFDMPWRMVPVPVLVGMLAHACRWLAITQAGASAETGAFVACLVAGIILTPVANRLRLPFAGVAFASVVSLIPGVFLFRLAGGMVTLVTLDTQALAPQASAALVAQLAADGAAAFLIILAMAFGLLLPRMFFNHLTQK